MTRFANGTKSHLISACLALGAICASLSALHGQEDPRWVVAPDINALDDFNVTPNSTALAKALTDAAEYVLRWTLPRDARDWKRRRVDVEGALKRAIGLETLPERTPLEARSVRRHEMGDHVLENVIFYSRPEFPVTANLYLPTSRGEGRLPAVLCPIGHSLDTGKARASTQALCIQLARLGFVALTYDAIGHGERLIPGNIHHEGGYALLPLGQTVAGWMVWDSMRAVDYLIGRPEVDEERIGITGNSGGGLNTLYTAALDSRIGAAAVVGYCFEFNNFIKYSGPHCTCTALPGLYRSMEWFEIAGLIAPRAVLILQGERDNIFPISGARRAGRGTEALFGLLGQGGRARFDSIPNAPHAYSRPFRERTYGWMLHHLKGEGSGEPVAEEEIETLPEDDSRLVCDKERVVIHAGRSVVELARREGDRKVGALAPNGSRTVREATRRVIRRLTAAPDREPHHLMPRSFGKTQVADGVLEKVYFVSEVGQHVPGLLWLPRRGSAPYSTVILVDDRGKASIAESGLVEPLLAAGLAVLAVDPRGRGETLGKVGPRRNNNYHLVTHSVVWGRPVAGRRAYDLKRAVDFVERRGDLSPERLAVVGMGDAALAALLAAADDERIRRVACGGYVSSFVSQMSAARSSSRRELLRIWNASAMRTGRVDNGTFEVDLGSVLPSILLTADVPDIASLVAPRRLLFCKARDANNADAERQRARFERVLSAARPGDAEWFEYLPQRVLDAPLLLEWLRSSGGDSSGGTRTPRSRE